MSESARETFRKAAAALKGFDTELCKQVREGENHTDHYEDLLGSYLVKLSALQISQADSNEAAMLLKAIGDFERIGDHCSNTAGCVVDRHHHNRNTHEALRSARVENRNFEQQYRGYAEKYSLK